MLSLLLAQTNFGGGFNQANDDFEDAAEITGCSGSVAVNNEGATAEPGEPDHSQNSDLPTHTVWYEFTAFNNAEMTLDTAGSDFDTMLAVYTGDRFDNLQFIRGNPTGPIDEGSAYVFTLNVSFRWVELQKLVSPDPAHRDWFGLAVAVYADTNSDAGTVRPNQRRARGQRRRRRRVFNLRLALPRH